ncbi:MAG: baseplate J/gp47 family protein [Bacteroidota bacterium]
MSLEHQNTDRNCACDTFVFLEKLNIPAGLSFLPRQWGTFADFRQVMLREISQHAPLANWTARETDDFGVMLLEMWAYLCDSLTFYDEVYAQEHYVRTAQERRSLRKLIEKLGYIPRPAIAAMVQLAAQVSGRKVVDLPKGMAFRSAGFDEEAPQVFELDQKSSASPFKNEWNIEAPRSSVVGYFLPDFFYVKPSVDLEENAPLFVQHKNLINRSLGSRIAGLEEIEGIDGEKYTKVTFPQRARILPLNPLNTLSLYRPTQQASLWSAVIVNGAGVPVNPSLTVVSGKTRVTLDKQYDQIKAGQYILLEYQEEFRVFKVEEVKVVKRLSEGSSTMEINGFEYNIPGLKVSVTQLVLDERVNYFWRKPVDSSTGNWTDSLRDQITVHYQMQRAGEITAVPREYLRHFNPINLTNPLANQVQREVQQDFFLQDINEQGEQVRGQFYSDQDRLQLDQGTSWSPGLQMPVKLLGNVLTASRGESVHQEVLGTGDGTLANQEFKLQKAPLTYLSAPSTETGVQSTLKVYVDNIMWTEVKSFFGTQAEDRVFVVRQDDEEDSFVTFGDGIRGQRLTTGAVVTADYRHGAGAAAPPAGAVNQIAQPVDGLTSVTNPTASFGGADREAAENIRENAPRSALILGRAISMADMQAVAAGVPGVLRVEAQWAWDIRKQRPVVSLWYIGEDHIQSAISERLRGLTDPNTPFQVYKATPITVSLTIDVQIDSTYQSEPLIAAIQERLLEQPNGILRNDQQTIGRTFFRSQLFGAVLAVPGTIAVNSVIWNNWPFIGTTKRPGTGHYFDFEAGELIISTQSASIL